MVLRRLSFGLVVGAALTVCVPAHATITYTCDPSITGGSAGQLGLSCATLNSTLNTIYNAAFVNATASIYISLSSSSSLGENVRDFTLVPYGGSTGYLAALTADDPGNPGLASLPSTNPYGTGDISLTNAQLEALPLLGITPTRGIMDTSTPSDIITCTLGNAGCFDAVLWVNDLGSTGNLWLRTGTEQSGQYDFYSVVEHETDEVLGTASCLANGTGDDACEFNFPPDANSDVSAADLFRYVCGSTSRSFSAVGNACFSLNGGVTDLKQYNNTTNGDDFGDWSSNCANVQDATACPDGGSGSATFDHDLSASAEIGLLDVVGFSSPATPEPGTFVLVGAALLGAGWLKRRKRG
jgi:hypothetical protein